MAEKKEEEKEVWPMMNMDSSVNITDPGLGYLGLGYTCQTCRGEGPGIDCRVPFRRCHQLSWRRYQENMTEETNNTAPRVFYPLTHGPKLKFAMHKDVNLSIDLVSLPRSFWGVFYFLTNRPRET